jgi:hypothetical protein
MGILAAVVLLMLAGAIPVGGETQTVIFRTPLFVLLLGLLCGCLLVRSLLQRPSFRGFSFCLAHLGIAAVLAGAFIGYLGEKKSQLTVPVGEDHVVRQLTLGDGSAVDLGFGISLLSFDVVRYEPTKYNLFRPGTVVQGGQEKTEYALIGAFKIPSSGDMDLGSEGTLPLTALREAETGKWKAQYVLGNGNILQVAPPPDKEYKAVLRIDDGGGRTIQEILGSNMPVDHRGWRFYLMSYDTESLRYIMVTARKDPGRCLAIGGMFAAMIGIALMCFAGSGEGRHEP